MKNIPLKNKIKQLDDVGEHKMLVMKSCYNLARKLMLQGNDKFALDLMDRGFLHDQSKLLNDEFYGMAEFAFDQDALKNAKSKISDNKQKAIELHWERNKHHPEYWDDINKMSDLDIAELTCDWFARSEQFGTDMLDFLKQRQKDRFHFPKNIYDKIVKYYYMLKE